MFGNIPRIEYTDLGVGHMQSGLDSKDIGQGEKVGKGNGEVGDIHSRW